MVKHDNWQGVPIVTMDNEWLSVSLCPSLGNNLYRIYDKKANREVLRVPPSPEELKAAPVQYGTPLLLPPNRIRQGAFRFRDRDYQLDLNHNGHHIHGFLKSRPWKVTDIGKNSVKSVFAVAEFKDVLKMYPHPLVIEMTYSLEGPSLIQKTKVLNQGPSPAPFGYGVHTWFLLDGQPEQWTLKLPSAHIWELDETLMPTGSLLPLGEFASLPAGMNLKGVNLDTVFQIGDNSCEAVLEKDGCRIRYRGSEQFKHWVIYTKGEANDYICLEPYTWVTNAPNLALDPAVTGLRAVEPEQSLELTLTLEIESL